ncbi:MAG: histidinol-phosphate aminotransferase family protein [Nitrosarchaeum sp.]|nr:histidinol-phosphate aminotransferase family protein [Nitrosarchaeum sp.]
MVGNGATEIIYNFCQAFLSNKTPVLIPIPTFGEYESAAKLSGAKISFFKTMNLEKDVDGFISKLPNNGCIFICNPNNLTGNLISKKTLQKIIISANKKKTLVFIDECFIELVPDHDESIIKFIKKYNNLFILRSLTKSFALAGLRIGYGIGSKQMISVLNKIKIPWNVSGLAQQAASTALLHSFYLTKVKKMIKKESFYLINYISKLKNFQCNTTSTNFILIKTKMKSQTLQKKLLEKKILVRDCSTIRGLNNNYIRIAVKTRKENEKLIKALEQL